MKIIKRGDPKRPSQRFTCTNCETIFEADYGEYHNADQIEYMHDGILYKCQCPVCNEMAYVDRE